MSIRQPKTSYEEARAKARAVRGQRPVGNAGPEGASPATSQPAITDRPAQTPLRDSALPDAVAAIASQADARAENVDRLAVAARAETLAAPPVDLTTDTPHTQAPMPPTAPRLQHTSTHIGRRVRLAVIVRYPRPGYSKTFDQIAAAYDPHRAMRQITKLALDRLEADPQFSRTNPSTPYPPGDGQLVTSRTVDEAFFNAARKVFDPLNLESTLAVSNFIVGVALAAFFENDRAS